jgi:hypothetical protein
MAKKKVKPFTGLVAFNLLIVFSISAAEEKEDSVFTRQSTSCWKFLSTSAATLECWKEWWLNSKRVFFSLKTTSR